MSWCNIHSCTARCTYRIFAPFSETFICSGVQNWVERRVAVSQKKYSKMDTTTKQDLRAVFELCEPNPEGLISLRKLQELFQSHSPNNNSVSLFSLFMLSIVNSQRCACIVQLSRLSRSHSKKF